MLNVLLSGIRSCLQEGGDIWQALTDLVTILQRVRGAYGGAWRLVNMLLQLSKKTAMLAKSSAIARATSA